MALNILSVGGSDPSSGAGIQSDIRTCQALHAHCLTAVTAVTSQNTSGFGTAEPVSAGMLRDQLELLFSDFAVDGIKIGMVYSRPLVRVIADFLKDVKIPVVLDPVVRSTTGGMLIKKSAIPYLGDLLIPACTAITPNKSEAEFLTGIEIKSITSAGQAAKRLQGMGAENVVITGLEFTAGQITDHILAGSAAYQMSQKKIPVINHGSGCTYSMALCHALASKKPIKAAARFSKQFTRNAIRNSESIGHGVRIAQKNPDRIYEGLLDGIRRFMELEGIHAHIPECQTNFVFSKPRPASIRDVMGIEGRIVKTGNSTVMAGRLRYGGSKHVASAVLAASKKFPAIRAAVNIRFHPDTISSLRRAKLRIKSYDRRKEPKTKYDNSSVIWGTSAAIRTSGEPPDAIFHRGDIGKEPMIVLFGRTPAELVRKLHTALNAG